VSAPYGASVLPTAYGGEFGGYGASVQAPFVYGQSVEAQQGYHTQPHQGYHGGGGGRGGAFHQGHQKVYHPPLPEHERCTVKVTGIPAYMTEADLREHFDDFGHIVSLQLTEAPSKRNNEEATTTEGDKKRTYLECLIQYHSAANAKKCLTSTRSVKDNRMIQIRRAYFNLIPPAEVEFPGDEVVARDAAIVAGTYVAPTRAAPSRKKPYSAMAGAGYQPPGSNKYRRGVGDAHYNLPASNNHSDAPTADNAEEQAASTAATVGSPVASGSAMTQEQLEAKEKFEQLKQLRLQAEEIAKKKEAILQVSIL
jgi:hypothetical protein